MDKTDTAAPAWWQSHDNMVTLTRYMADNLHGADDIADAVEKPWKFHDVWLLAQEEQARD
jgi:hypothetical protein